MVKPTGRFLSGASRRGMMQIKLGIGLGAAVFAALVMVNNPASAQSLGYADPNTSFWSADRTLPQPGVADEDSALPDRLKRTLVNYPTREAPGTIIVDTRNTYLYLIAGDNRAIRYGVGVGREGFTWSGVQTIARKAEWPDWHPPAQMIARQPYLPRFVAGGPGNPLGARAMYLGNSDYRIHGTNDPSTIGKFVSSGCIRLTNEDVTDLFNRVKIGAKVIVLPKAGSPQFEAKQAPASHRPVTSPAQTAGPPIKLSSIN